MASQTHPIWIVPGAPWRQQVNACRRLLIEAAKADRAVGIDELVNILPLNPVDGDSVADIVARGAIAFVAGSAENDGGDVTRASFLDDNIGSVRVVIPKVLKAIVTVQGETLTLASADPKILLILPDLPPQYPFSGNFMLDSITIDEISSSYLLKDQVEPFGPFEVKVDLQQEPTPLAALASLRSLPAHRRRKLALAMKAMSSEEDTCFAQDNGKPEWFITRASFGACRIQHGNEHVLGTIIFGPETMTNCQKKLDEFQQNGTCP